jgi:hypothetical protein
LNAVFWFWCDGNVLLCVLVHAEIPPPIDSCFPCCDKMRLRVYLHPSDARVKGAKGINGVGNNELMGWLVTR